jgi:hypothetical protein
MATQRVRRDPSQLTVFDGPAPATDTRRPSSPKRRLQSGTGKHSPSIRPAREDRRELRLQRESVVNGLTAPDLAALLVASLDEHALDALADALLPRLTSRLSAREKSPDDWLDARRAAAYVGLSRNALHKHTAARAIPFHQDGPACKLWFRRDELDAWRAAGGARNWKP